MHLFLVKNRVFVCLFFAAVLLSAGESFAALNTAKISIKAKDKYEKTNKAWETEVETEENLSMTSFQTETKTYTLYVKLKNDGDQEQKGVLEWCFISDHSTGETYDEMPTKAVPATFSPGRRALTIAPHTELSESIVSEPFMFEKKSVETEWYTGDGGTSENEYETGDVYKGYVLLFTVNGEILAKASSSSRYLKDDWIEQCRKAISAKE